MESNENIAKIFKALCDENRIAVIMYLRDGEKCACELYELLEISKPTISHHMKILVESGIVLARKEGKWTHYSLSEKGVFHAKNTLDSIFEKIEKKNETRCDC